METKSAARRISSSSNETGQNFDSLYNSVKSTAVVKYSAVQTPTAFDLLRCNTDLNLPPSNWLSSSAESYGLQYVLSNSSGFSSFRMADMFPDYVGEIDVVSDSENIKKLLKLPYSRGPVSMIIHRIKATLLIDDFDIHKYLFRNAEQDWNWLKKLILENVFPAEQHMGKCITHENKRRYALQQENLMSKFLHHSLGKLDETKSRKNKTIPKNEEPKKSKSQEPTSPSLPELNLEDELPDLDADHVFARNVVWTFEDIQMLLGSDMPIFGGDTHPCISLRLRDMLKPISVLTGIDYWLDNLMCNVPEVAMCYHIEGIVQKYDLIKTEDLPYMEGSKFSPSLIRDVAQNILAFLKSNATKAGHTYWLIKGRDDDIVKLYDLTSLCSSTLVDKDQNPFTIPVALLLYRVARNMKHSSCNNSTNPATIRMLLKNCIKLLPKENYPQIVTSAHYMYSDSLIPLNTDPTSPNLGNDHGLLFRNNDKVSENINKNDSNSVHVKTLCISNKNKIPVQPNNDTDIDSEEECDISHSVEMRCKIALHNIAQGLNCLQYFDTPNETRKKQRKSKIQKDSNIPKMANPSQVIPLPYEKIDNPEINSDISSTSTNLEKFTLETKIVEPNKDIKKQPENSKEKGKKKKKKNEHKSNETNTKSIGALLCKSQVETIPTWHKPPDSTDIISWKRHLRTLLYEKACLVYATLAEWEYANESYGSALKHIRFMLQCRSHLSNRKYENDILSYLLGRAGDCCFQIACKWQSSWQAYKTELITNLPEDDEIINEMKAEESTPYKELSFFPSDITTLDNILNSSWMCYSKALELEPRETERNNLQRRLGNICNELGSFYMNQAAVLRVEKSVTIEKMQAYFAISLTHLENGIKAFKLVKDDPNLALLYSNTGRLMRLMAHYYSKENVTLSAVAKSFYTKAFNNYQLALSALSYRRLNPEIWDTIFWELSTTLFTMASLLQDFPHQDMDIVELEREVTDYLTKALKYCDLETPGPRQPLYQFRAAEIHHRLASLYHNTYRNLDKDSPRRNKVLQLCNLHYDRAIRLYTILEAGTHCLRTQLEQVALYEYQEHCTASNCSKIKFLQLALDLILNCGPFLKMLIEKSSSEKSLQDLSNENDESKDTKKLDPDEKLSEEKEEHSLLTILEGRFQVVLRTLTKRCTGAASSQAKLGLLVPKYKEMYSTLLRKNGNVSLQQHLLTVIELYKHMVTSQ